MSAQHATTALWLRRAQLVGRTGLFDVRIADGVVAGIHPSPHAPAAGPPAGGHAPAAGPPLAAAESVDLDGRFVVPGLWDHHVHFNQWAQASQRIDLAPATSAVGLADLVAAHLAVGTAVGTTVGTAVGTTVGTTVAGRTAAGTAAHAAVAATAGDDQQLPVVGFGFRDGLWPDAPSRAVLDRVTGSRPAVMVSGDLHSAWLNSAALRRYGHGEHPTGLLREAEAMRVLGELSQVPEAIGDRWADAAARAAAARGVVGIVDLEKPWAMRSWVRRVQGGSHHLRVRVGVWAERLDDAIALGLRTGDPVAGGAGLVAMGPFKVITDGSLNTRTAFCHDRYPGLADDEHPYGLLLVEPGELRPLLQRATEAGLDCAVHAIGDHANSLALRAMSDVGAHGSIEHAQLLDAADLPRFAELGVLASVQPEHAMDDRDVADHHWSGRTERAFVLRGLLDAGAGLLLGSDAPVAPLDPWIAISAAVSRTRDGRPAWHPEQRITVAEALAASYAPGRGGGPITLGEVADLVVLDDDPHRREAAALRTMPVAATMLGGRWTHRAGI